MTLIDMSEREYFAQFAKRTGMFIGCTSLTGATAFMVGYDQAARRHGGAGLTGWREWLMKNYEVSGNLTWQAQIQQVAIPGWSGGGDLSPQQEAHVLKMLFNQPARRVSGRAGRPGLNPLTVPLLGAGKQRAARLWSSQGQPLAARAPTNPKMPPRLEPRPTTR